MHIIYRGKILSKHTQSAQNLAPLAFAILTLSACGEGTVGGLSPSTITLDTQLTNPQPNSNGISTTAPLKIVIKEELDFSSVNELNVHLMPGQGHSMDAGDDDAEEDATLLNNDPIPGVVFYDPGTKTISFTPKIAMDQGRSYHIHASNLLLKGGKKVSTGIDIIKFSFTTSHAHEFYRKELNDVGQIKEERYTDTENNERVMRTQYEYNDSGAKELDYIRHYGPMHQFSGKSASDISVYWQQDGATNGIQRYEVKRKGSDDIDYNVRVRFKEPYPSTTDIVTDPVHNIWTADEKHGTAHQISYQYEPVADRNTTPTPWPTSGNPKTAEEFQLDDAQLMQMDHSAAVSSTTNVNDPFQHRHIFYGDLGDNKEIDFNDQHNPAPVDDEIRVYHTRDIVNYLRTHEWSWLGISRKDKINRFGVDETAFTTDDVASRLRIYIFDDKGRRAQRVTFEVPRENTTQAPYGLTRTEWTQLLQQNGYKGHELASYGVSTVNGDQPAYDPGYALTASNNVPVKVHSYRIYEYEADSTTQDPTTSAVTVVPGGLNKVTVWHENSDDTALVKEEIRYYTTQPTVRGEELATQLNLD